MNLWGIIKGLLVQDETDRSKELSLEIDPAATTATRTTVKAAQTANRTIVLPNASTTLTGTDNSAVITNKTIDADLNTITNIDDGNIKVGAAIDAAKLADGSVSNAEFQRINSVTSNVQDQLDANALAISNHIADATDAHDASAISSVPSGNLSATDVQAALNELQSDIDTRALDSALTAHINDATDAHDASAISNVPAGSISATDVQSAVNELDGDIQGHISDAIDAHDASAISNVPSGNLAATDVQAALNELQTDVDTRATTAANVGTGQGNVFRDKTTSIINLKTIKAGTNVTITDNADDITIASSGGGGGSTFLDNAFRIQDNGDATKQLAFEVAAITTATTRTWTVPDVNINFNTVLANTGTFANSNLSNLGGLSGITAVNLNLLPDATNTRSLGTGSFQWVRVGALRHESTRLSAPGTGMIYTSSSNMDGTYTGVPSPGAGVTWFDLTGQVPLYFLTSLNTVNDATNTSNIFIQTGNKTTGTGNSGSMTLLTGSSAGGERGFLTIDTFFAVLPKASADPTHTGLVSGAVYYNTTSNKIKMYNGTTWETVTSV